MASVCQRLLLAAGALTLSLCSCYLLFPFDVQRAGDDAALDGALSDVLPDRPAQDTALGDILPPDILLPDILPTDLLPPGAKLIPYPDRKLSPGVGSTHFNDVWDLTACSSLRQVTGCDLELRCTVDLSGVTTAGQDNQMWTEVGLREQGAKDFNPGLYQVQPGGKGVWLLAWAVDLQPDPTAFNTNDNIVIQSSGGLGQGQYDIRDCSKPAIGPSSKTTAGFGFRFDRDDADAAHKAHPLAAKSKSYDTGGVYTARLCFRSFSATSGAVCGQVNGLSQGLNVSTKSGTMPDFYPAGVSFAGDMTAMQVFVGFARHNSGAGVVELRDLRVVGCPAASP